MFSKDRQLIPESANDGLKCRSITGKRISQTSQYPTFKKPVVNDYGTSIRNVREQGFQKRWTWVGCIGMQVFVMCNSTVGLKNVTTILKRKFFVDPETVEPSESQVYRLQNRGSGSDIAALLILVGVQFHRLLVYFRGHY